MSTPAATSARPLLPLTATVLVGAMAALLDTTIVAVALDELARDLAAPVTTIQWVTTSYVLAMTAVIPLVGWSVGRFGARAVWLTALGLFLLGSILCGAAWSAGSLIAFRTLQGLGGGMILPVTQLVLARAAGPERLGRVMGKVGFVGQIAPISGPVLGGVLIDGWGWRWVFFVNVPLVLMSLAMTWRWFPRDEERDGRRLDLVGLLLLPAGVVALLYALTGLEADAETGAPAAVTTVVTVTAGTGLLAAFVARSLRRGEGSLLDLGLFTDRTFRSGTVMMFVLGVTSWGPMFLLPLYYQRLHSLSALDAGLALAPQALGVALASLLIGQYTDRLPPRPLVLAGMAVATAGTLPFVFATAGTDTFLLSGALLLRGVGFGVASLSVSVAVYRTLRPAAIPHATSASTVVQRIGAATGTALMAVILQAGGFPSALTWMFILTATGLAMAASLPGHK
ncbi:MDR family MFS transporter [Streptosporangium sp. NBC_01756]|uniref:MDR family MFS transporter n=1 Tax=Streptosporangium sp. NBC_01756 TaxID=2975950 RepID=UPI002DDB16EF|nr:MDR family MFS transporter [Streptosporangium sp. NBC_01756]WSC86261.1 multidrug efflux MFS transporter [Streptosporangium sp. NBC_01756]